MIEQKTNTAVVILNWNGIDWLKQFIPTLIENTPASEADLIVADNASSDESVDYLKQNHPEIQLIILDQNYGFAEGYNRALKQITHPYSILLNSDVEVTKNWVQPLINQLESSDKTAACQPKIKDFYNKDYFEYAGASGGFIDYMGYPFCRGRIFNELEQDKGQYDTSISIFWATGACLAIKTDLYNKTGGLDSEFFAHMEEIDLCWRLKSLGYDIYAVPKSTVYHVGGGTLSKVSPKKTYLNFRNNLLILYKNLPPSQLFKILFLRLILDGVAGLKFVLSGEFSHMFSIIKAHFHFYGMMSRFKSKRQENIEKTNTQNILEVYSKSIVWEHFFNKKSNFSLLEPKKLEK